MSKRKGMQHPKVIILQNQIISLWNQGQNRTQIANELKIHPAAVGYALKVFRKKGANVRQGKISIAVSALRREKIVQLYWQGKTPLQIATELHIPRAAVYLEASRLRRKGVDLPATRSSVITVRRKKIQKLWDSHSAAKIAKILQVSLFTVNKDIHYLRSQGVKLRYKSRENKK